MPIILVFFASILATQIASAAPLSYRVVSQNCTLIPSGPCTARYHAISLDVQVPGTRVIYEKNAENAEGGIVILESKNEISEGVFGALSFEPSLKYLNYSFSAELFGVATEYVIARVTTNLVFYKISDTQAFLQETTSLTGQDGATSTRVVNLQLEKK